MIAMDVSEAVTTKLASPIVFVPKKGNTPLLSVDNRKLNALTIWDLYQIPHIDEYIDSLDEGMVI